MRTAVVDVIDSAISGFQRVIELQSTDIHAKSSEKLGAIAIQFGPAPNGECIRNQVFRPKPNARRRLWQLNNLVFDIDREGRNILMEDAIGEAARYFDRHLVVISDGAAEVSGGDTVAERPRFAVAKKSNIGARETACTRMISEAIHIHACARTEANGTQIMTV